MITESKTSDTGFSAAVRSDEFYDNPYPTYKRLRDERPLFFDEPSNLWLVSRHEDISAAVNSPQTFSSSQGNALVDSPLRVGKTLGSMDPPRHDELRAIVVRGINPRRVANQLPVFEASVTARLDELEPKRTCDLVGDFIRPLIVEALGVMLGLDVEAARRSARLQANLFHNDDGPLGAALEPAKMAEVFELLTAQLSRRRTEPSDDLFSVLLEAQSAGLPISNDEIVANLSTVLLAGAASVGHFAPNIFHALWANPIQRRRVLTDMSKVDAAIEETVRWDTSTQSFARVLLRPATISGFEAPAGARLALLYGSANRDERAIAQPDEFNIERGRVRHFGFGGGPHHCLGAPTARQLCKALLNAALPRLGEFELNLAEARRVKHMMVRGFSSVQMEW